MRARAAVGRDKVVAVTHAIDGRFKMIGVFQPHHGRHHEPGAEPFRQCAQHPHARARMRRRDRDADVAQTRFPERRVAAFAFRDAPIGVCKTRIGGDSGKARVQDLVVALDAKVLEIATDVGLAHLPNSFLKAWSLKPTLTRSSLSTTGRLTSAGYSFSSKVHSGSLAGFLRCGNRLRHVVDALLTSFSQPPSCLAHSLSAAAGTGFAR